MRAWKVYDDNYDRNERKPLDFPVRRVPKAETCRVALVDDPFDYYDAAIKAGPRIFGNVLPSARSPIDIGRLARAILVMQPQLRPLRPIADSLQLTHSDRQFAYAMEFTPLHLAVLRLARESGMEGARLLMERYGSFLDRQWKQKRCSGNEWISYKGIVEEYNSEAIGLEKKFADLKLPRLKADAWWAQAVDPDSYSERNEDIWDLTMVRLKIDGSPIDGVSSSSVLREVEEFRPAEKLLAWQRLLQKHFAFHELLIKYRDTEWEKNMMVSWLAQVSNGRLYREAPLVWWAVLRDVKEWAGKNEQRRALIESAGDSAMRAWLRLETLDGR